MSLLNMSLPVLLVGLAALAAVLFLLQRLRVRYRQRTVITTLFWKQALEEARARVLVRRFRHPLAYLLVLLIASLLWLGFAGPELAGTNQRDQLVLLDGSAGMARGQRFARTVGLLKERLATLPTQRLRVIFCGGRSRTLLRPGENALLLEARLEALELQPEACPATVDTTLRLLTRTLDRGRETDVLVAGDAPVSKTTVDLLPPRLRLRRLAPPPEASQNRGITALGVAESSSGAWERVDVLCEVSGHNPPPVSVTLDGKPVELQARSSVDGPNRTRILFEGVPASGQLLTVQLDGANADPLPADDSATIRLPKRKRIRVAIDPPLLATVGPVLKADPAVLVVENNPDVVVCRERSRAAGVPSLAFVPIESQADAILLHHVAGRSETVLVESFQRLGLAEVDAMEMAQASGRQIAVAAVAADQRRISVWEPLLGERFNFVQCRSFPLFVAQAIRWLAQVESDPAFVAAGEALAGNHRAHVDADGIRLDPAGAEFLPPRAGVYRDAGGGALAASLLDPATTGATGGVELEPLAAGADQGRGFDAALWLAAAVLALLFLEWLLLRTGRMP